MRQCVPNIRKQTSVCRSYSCEKDDEIFGLAVVLPRVILSAQAITGRHKAPLSPRFGRDASQTAELATAGPSFLESSTTQLKISCNIHSMRLSLKSLKSNNLCSGAASVDQPKPQAL
jgi:hypothetical protein